MCVRYGTFQQPSDRDQQGIAGLGLCRDSIMANELYRPGCCLLLFSKNGRIANVSCFLLLLEAYAK